MDISETTAPKSDQQNFDDYISGPKTVTISSVTKGSMEQPVNVELVEFPGRPYKPNKSMRRVLMDAWGTDTTKYVGRRLTLFGNPDVMFGGKAVGGIEISHLSDIDGPKTIPLTVSKGKRKAFTVQPLTTRTNNPVDSVLADEWISTIDSASTTAQLEAAWRGAVDAGVARDSRVIRAKDDRKRLLS